MSDEDTPVRDHLTQVCSTAHKVRVTAGVGTLHQKTWVLRRPATLVGSGKQAQIVLPPDNVGRAHCLIVNTGAGVLLKDLHSRTGTRCNDRWADLVSLSDGDVLRLGESVLQIAIQAGEPDPDGSIAGLVYTDPLVLPEALQFRRADNGECWRVEQAVAVIGRSPGAAIRLDHPDISLAHAAVIGAGGQLLLIDLDSRTGTSVNGESRPLSSLQSGDRIGVGPFELGFHQTVDTTRPACSAHETVAGSGASPWEAMERLREELDHRSRELDEKAARLDRDQHAVEAARLSIEKERSALLRQAAALREADTAVDARRRSLEQREKILRENLLRQAQGSVSGVAGFTVTAGSPADNPRMSAVLN